MANKIFVGPFNKGLRNDVTAFNIDNDSFPTLINAYQWRGRVKRKRGTTLLNRLRRYFDSLSTVYNSGSTTITLDGSGIGNLITGFSLETNANIVPGSVIITAPGPTVYTDPSEDGTLDPSGSINYASGEITIAAEAGNAISASFLYYPNLPVMGLKDLVVSTNAFPGTLAFDTTYAYNIITASPYNIYDVSFYKNPLSGTYADYVEKTLVTPLTWNGTSYQQFWTVNYQGALWATNGITTPFSATNIGMQYKRIVDSTVLVTGPPSEVSFQITAHGLVVGDFVFINEVSTSSLTGIVETATNGIPVSIKSTAHGLSTGNTVTFSRVEGMVELNGNTYTVTVVDPDNFTLDGTDGTTFGVHVAGTGLWTSPESEHPGIMSDINFQTGYVITVTDPNNVVVEFPNATITTNSTGGIAQYLTNRSDTTKDCLRWYDGDPTDGNAITPTLDGHKGWVNFCPPLSISNFSIGDLPANIYYLVGARLIIPFKDRLVFLGVVLQTSEPGSQVYLKDTIVYSQNGTPYYTASFTGDPTFVTTIFNPILVPTNQTATPNAYWEDQTGFGGFITSGFDEEILSVSTNQDVLMVGFEKSQAKLAYSGNDIVPFNFYVINSEYGTNSTFSAVNLDKGVLSRGERGIILTSQNEALRIDLDIPDEVFQINLKVNGNERFTSQRDFISEWVYFTYPVSSIEYTFPNQTLQFNYRDNSWAVFRECYTTYGQFRKQSGFIWSTVGDTYPTWEEWSTPWNAGSSSLLQPLVIGGNQQGFVIFRNTGTSEAESLYIKDIVGSVVTSPDHTLNIGDYIILSGCLGTVGAEVNDNIFSVQNADDDTFELNPPLSSGLTYLGAGQIKRMYVPLIQTKQFPVAWEMARKTRIGAQKYLFTATDDSQVSIYLYLSQNANAAYNLPPIYPLANSENNSLIYSTPLNTGPDYYTQRCYQLPLGSLGNNVDTTLELNLMQIFGFFTPIIAGTVVITVGDVATFTDDGAGGFTVTGTGVSAGSSVIYSNGDVTLVFSVAPDEEVSNVTMNYQVSNILSPVAEAQAQIWHRINTSLIGDTIQVGITLSDEQMRDTLRRHQFAEIELHAFSLDVSPSQELA